MNNKKASLVNLPNLILQRIFKFCDIKTILQLLKTCKFIKNFINQNSDIWGNLVIDFYFSESYKNQM